MFLLMIVVLKILKKQGYLKFSGVFLAIVPEKIFK